MILQFAWDCFFVQRLVTFAVEPAILKIFTGTSNSQSISSFVYKYIDKKENFIRKGYIFLIFWMVTKMSFYFFLSKTF